MRKTKGARAGRALVREEKTKQQRRLRKEVVREELGEGNPRGQMITVCQGEGQGDQL